MKRFVIFFLLISPSFVAQELKLMKATSKAINQTISATSTINYSILIKKEKSFKWSVDSVIDVYTQKSVQYHIAKADDPDKPLKSFSKNYKGVFQITFFVIKTDEVGGPKTPMNLKVPVLEFTQGVIIYYRAGKKKEQMAVESFEVLELSNVH